MRIHWVCHKSTPFSPVRRSWPVTWLPAFTTWLGSLPHGGGGSRGCHSNLVHGDATVRCCRRRRRCCFLGCHDDLSLGDGVVNELLVLRWRWRWFGVVQSDSLAKTSSDMFMFLDNYLIIYVAVIRQEAFELLTCTVLRFIYTARKQFFFLWTLSHLLTCVQSCF